VGRVTDSKATDLSNSLRHTACQIWGNRVTSDSRGSTFVLGARGVLTIDMFSLISSAGDVKNWLKGNKENWTNGKQLRSFSVQCLQRRSQKPHHYAHVHNQSLRLGCSLIESRRAESGRAVPKTSSTI
jgi:hypothetical protein